MLIFFIYPGMNGTSSAACKHSMSACRSDFTQSDEVMLQDNCAMKGNSSSFNLRSSPCEKNHDIY